MHLTSWKGCSNLERPRRQLRAAAKGRRRATTAAALSQSQLTCVLPNIRSLDRRRSRRGGMTDMLSSARQADKLKPDEVCYDESLDEGTAMLTDGGRTSTPDAHESVNTRLPANRRPPGLVEAARRPSRGESGQTSIPPQAAASVFDYLAQRAVAQYPDCVDSIVSWDAVEAQTRAECRTTHGGAGLRLPVQVQQLARRAKAWRVIASRRLRRRLQCPIQDFREIRKSDGSKVKRRAGRAGRRPFLPRQQRQCSITWRSAP